MLRISRWAVVVLAVTTIGVAVPAAAEQGVSGNCHYEKNGEEYELVCAGDSPGGGSGEPLTPEELISVYQDQWLSAGDRLEAAETDYDRACARADRRSAQYNITVTWGQGMNWTQADFDTLALTYQDDLETAAQCRGVQDAARQVVSSIGLEPPRVGIVPRSSDVDPQSVGLVGLQNWMWVDQPDTTTFGPASVTGTIDAWTISATAWVASVDWDMGDGQVVRCQGAGTPYEERFGFDPSPDCGHVYTKQGRYTVTATAHWTAEWSATSGESGVITVDIPASAPVVIGELHTIRKK